MCICAHVNTEIKMQPWISQWKSNTVHCPADIADLSCEIVVTCLQVAKNCTNALAGVQHPALSSAFGRDFRSNKCQRKPSAFHSSWKILIFFKWLWCKNVNRPNLEKLSLMATGNQNRKPSKSASGLGFPKRIYSQMHQEVFRTWAVWEITSTACSSFLCIEGRIQQERDFCTFPQAEKWILTQDCPKQTPYSWWWENQQA